MSNAKSNPTATDTLLAVGDATDKLFTRSDRSDLSDRVQLARLRLDEQHCTIAVVGEFKMGKSSLVNSIINAPLSPVDDDVATAKPLQVHHADAPSASILYKLEEDETENRIRTIEFEEVESYMLEPPTARDHERAAMVRIGLPRKLFANGMTIIDTPGVGGLGSNHAAQTLGVLSMADAVLFVSDAAQELTAPELEFLDLVRDICPTIAMVMPKVDFYPHWRHIQDLNVGHLERRGVEMVNFPISSTLRQIAISQNNASLNEESGYKHLVDHLRDNIEHTVAVRSRHKYLGAVSEALADLERQLLSEKAILDDPDAAKAQMDELEAQRDQAEALRSRAARWQQTLADGVGDLTSDVEHDLRSRFRDLVKQLEVQLETDDPARIWDDFAASATNEVNRAVSQNFGLLHQRAGDLAEQVGEHFGEDHEAVVTKLTVSSPADFDAAPEYDDASISSKQGVFGSGVTALRGGIGGFVMVGIIGTAVSVTPAAWVAPVVAALMGRKTRRDEALRALEKRQREAKTVLRKYVDEAQFVAAKDARDSLRHINRQLREHYLERAEEVKRSTNETLAAAKAAMQSTAEQRKRRATEIGGALVELDKLREHLVALDNSAELVPSAELTA